MTCAISAWLQRAFPPNLTVISPPGLKNPSSALADLVCSSDNCIIDNLIMRLGSLFLWQQPPFKQEAREQDVPARLLVRMMRARQLGIRFEHEGIACAAHPSSVVFYTQRHKYLGLCSE
jgi:hypothetical protein